MLEMETPKKEDSRKKVFPWVQMASEKNRSSDLMKPALPKPDDALMSVPGYFVPSNYAVARQP